MQNQYNFNSLSIICAAIVPLLVTGPFLPDLLVSISALWFVYYTVRYKFFYIYRNTCFYIFILFCLVCILSSILSDDIFLSFESSLFYFRIGIFALLISFLIEQDKKILDYFYYSFLITYTALVIDGFIQYFTGFNIIGYELNSDRVSSFFDDELILGSYLVRLLPLFFALFIIKQNKRPFEKLFCLLSFYLHLCIDIFIR